MDFASVPDLNNFNKQHGTKLVPIGNTILIRQGLISDKIHDLKDVPTGATVAIPNDPTNGGRALLLLQQAGLLRLKDGVGYKATPKDVTDNPKQLKFKELEAAQLPRSLADVDLAAITMNYILSSGIDPKKQGLFWEKKDEPLAVMVLAAREEDKDKPEFKKIVEIYKSETIKKFIEDGDGQRNLRGVRGRRRPRGGRAHLEYAPQLPGIGQPHQQSLPDG